MILLLRRQELILHATILGDESLIYTMFVGGIGGWRGGIVFNMLSEIFQLDLGGLFIHVDDWDWDCNG